MTIKEEKILKAIRKNGKEQIKIYKEEAKSWIGTQRGLEYEMKAEGIRQFLMNIQGLEIVDFNA